MFDIDAISIEYVGLPVGYFAVVVKETPTLEGAKETQRSLYVINHEWPRSGRSRYQFKDKSVRGGSYTTGPSNFVTEVFHHLVITNRHVEISFDSENAVQKKATTTKHTLRIRLVDVSLDDAQDLLSEVGSTVTVDGRRDHRERLRMDRIESVWTHDNIFFLSMRYQEVWYYIREDTGRFRYVNRYTYVI